MSATEHEHDDAEPDTADDTTTADDTDAEQEEAEQTESPAETPEQEAQEAQGPTPEEWEKRFKGAERAFGVYTRKIGDLWGDDATTLVPFNLDPSSPMGFIDPRNKGHVEDETRAAALAFLGLESETEVPDDPEARTCETCAGWGVTKTGSKVPNNTVRNCPRCKGIGWTIRGEAPHAQTVNVPDSQTATNGVTIPAATFAEDPDAMALRMRGYTVIPPMVPVGE